MNDLPEEIQDKIYKYKRQVEFKSVMSELNDIVGTWCDNELDAMYCKSRSSHEARYRYFSNNLKMITKSIYLLI